MYTVVYCTFFVFFRQLSRHLVGLWVTGNPTANALLHRVLVSGRGEEREREEGGEEEGKKREEREKGEEGKERGKDELGCLGRGRESSLLC